jgi:DNA polymerase III, epsilon subunit and related 3''-5'' exonucleases
MRLTRGNGTNGCGLIMNNRVVSVLAEDGWRAHRYAVVDLEGSGGQDKEKEQILAIAIVTISGGKVRTDDLFYSLVKPGRPIKRLPWLMHNITNETVKDAPRFHELERSIGERLRHAVFVVHNARIDWKLLSRYMPILKWRQYWTR